jgi:ubiquinol-cytochrome c reductase subunit 8
MAHAYYNAVFNTFRRSRNQFLYVVPPFVAAYFVLDWAEKK